MISVGSGHYKVVCTECEKLISQCRCPAPNKEIKYTLCVDCSRKRDS